MNLTVLADNMTKKSTEEEIHELMKRAKKIAALDPPPEWLKKYANLGVDTLQPKVKVFKNFDEYPITQVASADTTLNIPALYAELDPDAMIAFMPADNVIHLGITTELRNNTRTHLYSLSESRLKGKILAKKRDINARTLSPHPASYKIRFLRESDFSLENVEKFILICFRRGKQS